MKHLAIKILLAAFVCITTVSHPVFAAEDTGTLDSGGPEETKIKHVSVDDLSFNYRETHVLKIENFSAAEDIEGNDFFIRITIPEGIYIEHIEGADFGINYSVLIDDYEFLPEIDNERMIYNINTYANELKVIVHSGGHAFSQTEGLLVSLKNLIDGNRSGVFSVYAGPVNNMVLKDELLISVEQDVKTEVVMDVIDKVTESTEHVTENTETKAETTTPEVITTEISIIETEQSVYSAEIFINNGMDVVGVSNIDENNAVFDKENVAGTAEMPNKESRSDSSLTVLVVIAAVFVAVTVIMPVMIQASKKRNERRGR